MLCYPILTQCCHTYILSCAMTGPFLTLVPKDYSSHSPPSYLLPHRHLCVDCNPVGPRTNICRSCLFLLHLPFQPIPSLLCPVSSSSGKTKRRPSNSHWGVGITPSPRRAVSGNIKRVRSMHDSVRSRICVKDDFIYFAWPKGPESAHTVASRNANPKFWNEGGGRGKRENFS
jgi:hypothetical protein